MNSRERTLQALQFKEPDRVPVDVWMSAGLRKCLGLTDPAAYDAFLDRHDVDLRYIPGPAYTGPAIPPNQDIWGVKRAPITVATAYGSESYSEVSESPLAGAQDAGDVARYGGWPSPDWFDYSGIEAQCEAVRTTGRAVVFMGDRLNRVAQLKPAMYLRGMDTILMDMAVNPDLAKAVFAHIRQFYNAYLERILEAANGKLDLLLTGDDFGAQGGPLVSPAMWQEFLADGFAGYIARAHEYGVRVIHHTCGSVRPLIPMMIERGLDVLQSLQPEAANMDAAELKASFGGRLAFHGAISIQQTLPFGTPQDVRAEVRDRIASLAPGGGYILCTSHNIQADTPTENVEALLDAYKSYRTCAE